MGSCNQIRDNIAAFQDGQLATAEKAVVQDHLLGCPACRQEASAQSAMKIALGSLRQRQNHFAPPARVWKEASRSWRQHDAGRFGRFQMQFALAGACLLLLTVSVVWARLSSMKDFPAQAVLNDYQNILHNSPALQIKTDDPDTATRWLRANLGSEIPTLDLKITGATLQNAAVLSNFSPKVGRLFYRTPSGAVVFYVAPKGVRFPDMASVSLERQSFHSLRKAQQAVLYGWQSENAGYGIVMPDGLDPKIKASFASAARGTTSNQ